MIDKYAHEPRRDKNGNIIWFGVYPAGGGGVRPNLFMECIYCGCLYRSPGTCPSKVLDEMLEKAK